MEFLGGIDGMNFKPISGYDNYLKGGHAFDLNNNSEFENILNQQTQAIHNAARIEGSIEVNSIQADMMTQSIENSTSANLSPAESLAKSFSSSLSGGINSVNASAEAANKAQEAMAMGEDISVHDVMIAAEKASLNMQMAMQLRNKLISAYTEINSIRV